jgi:hypothetical protein
VAIQIPTTGIPANPIVEFHRNDLVNPPGAPSVVETLKAIDPRVALNMALPVNDANPSVTLHNAMQAAMLKGSQLAEPGVNQAVLLELSKTQAKLDPATAAVLADAKSTVSPSLSRLDNLGSAALGQLLSNILEAEDLDPNLALKNKTNTAVVAWPSGDQNIPLASDPRAAMNILYQNLQNSGIFAGEQIKKLLMPAALSIAEETESFDGDVPQKATTLLSQLHSDSPQVRDAVKLLLRGDLAWQGLLLPNLYVVFKREDAWQQSTEDPGQVMKGARITMEVDLPHLGKLKVVGTQFGESVNLTIETSAQTKSILSERLTDLKDQISQHVKVETHVAISDGAAS